MVKLRALATRLHAVALLGVLGVLCVLLSGCTQKELCFLHPHTSNITLVFDWRNAPGAAPESMSAYLFPVDGDAQALRYEFSGCEGGTIKVPLGVYDIVCVNSDTRNITYTSTQTRNHFYLSTPTTPMLAAMGALGTRADAPPRAPGSELQRVTEEPNLLYRHKVTDIDCTEIDGNQTVVMYPEPALANYTVIIEDVPNLKYTAGVSGALTTLADGIHFYRGHNNTASTAATMPFALRQRSRGNDVAETLIGSFRTFGHPEGDHMAHILSVYVILANNEKWYYEVDVSDQVHNAPDPRNVTILVSGLPVPKPIVNGGGFHPEVDPWEPIYIPLPM